MNNNNFEQVNCAVCGADNTEKICERGQFGLPTHVVICKECGLSYLNPRWDKARYVHFYEKEYDKYYRPNVQKNTERAGINYYQPVYERLQKSGFLPDNIQQVLDIGSGDGNNLEYLMEKIPNANYHAIEPSEECRKTLIGMGVNMIGTDIDIDFQENFEGFFDVVIMRHVLEHFANPVSAMQKVRAILKDDGIAYIAVPNNLKFGNSKLLDNWFRVVHTYYFNVHSLENVFRKAGINALLMEEGDEYNQKELFVIVKKGKVEEVDIKLENYTIQKDVFDKKLKGEKTLINNLKRRVKYDIPQAFKTKK